MKTRLLHILKHSSVLVPATVAASIAQANPQGGVVAGGQATITTPDASTLQVNQSTSKAVINWKSFDIGEGETTRFVLPDSTGVTLNRVVGGDNPSEILGTLTSNGTVFVINPDGILFGPNSIVDVGGLVATTSDMDDRDFMAGTYRFTKPGKDDASIINRGRITVEDAGVAALVAPAVRNEGVITAKYGQIALGAANSFALDFYGDDLIKLELQDELAGEVIDLATGKPLADRVKNEGKLSADGGTVALKAATVRKVVNSVINNTGVIEANSIGMKNGKIVLSAATATTKAAKAPPQKVKISGTLSARGTRTGEKGGKIYVTGEAVETEAARIDASGMNGGGTVAIGGDYLGGKASEEELRKLGIAWEASILSTAAFISLDEQTAISADAIEEGNGGKIVAWADDTLATAASISARGGASGGNGGFIETSGKILDVSQAADASAVNGAAGTWLLDPANVDLASLQSLINTTLAAGSNMLVDADNQISGNGITITNSKPGVELRLLADKITLKNSSIKSTSNDFTLRLSANTIALTNTTIDNKSGFIRLSSRDLFSGTNRTLALSGTSIVGGNGADEDEIEIGDFESIRLDSSRIVYPSIQLLGYQIDISKSQLSSSSVLSIGTDCLDTPVAACSSSFLNLSEKSQIINSRPTRTQPYDPTDPNETSVMLTDFARVTLTNATILAKNADVYFTKAPKAVGTSKVLTSKGEIYFGNTRIGDIYPSAETLARQSELNPKSVNIEPDKVIQGNQQAKVDASVLPNVGGGAGQLLANGSFMLAGFEYAPISQHDPANYSIDNPSSILDTYGNNKSVAITELTCLSAIYAIIERAHGKPDAAINDYYEVGPKGGAVNTKGTQYLKTYPTGKGTDVNYALIQESLLRGDPVIANTNLPTINHFILIVGFKIDNDVVTYSFIDPYSGSAVGTFVQGQEFTAAGRPASLESIRIRG